MIGCSRDDDEFGGELESSEVVEDEKKEERERGDELESETVLFKLILGGVNNRLSSLFGDSFETTLSGVVCSFSSSSSS